MATMRIKKSCTGCRALSLKSCEFGFKVRLLLQEWKDPQPLEPCPKPTTIARYMVLREMETQANLAEYRTQQQAGEQSPITNERGK